MKITRRVFLGLLGASVRTGAATLRRSPYLQKVSSDRAAILWTTNEPGTGVVQFSSDKSFGRTAVATMRVFPPSVTRLPTTYYQYEAELAPLRAGIEYFYKINVDGETLTPEYSLHAAPLSGSFSFAAFGDSGLGSPEQRTVFNKLMAEPSSPAFVVHTGDIAYPSGTFNEFEAYYFSVYAELMKSIPFWTTPGNHEYYTDNALPYVSVTSVPTEGVPPVGRGRYYSFDWENIHFVSLDSNNPMTDISSGSGRPAMLDWLDRDLAATRKFWKIVFFHHTPYAVGNHEDEDVPQRVRDRIVPFLEQHNVQLVLVGHEHSYQRTKPIRNGVPVGDYLGPVYVTTGGAGAALFDVTNNSDFVLVKKKAWHYTWLDVQGGAISMRAMSAVPDEAAPIDQARFAPPPVVETGGVANSADFSGAVAPGSLISIFGRTLAAEDRLAETIPLPNSLMGLSVRVNNRVLPLVFVSSTQVNAQLPYDTVGPASLRVTTANGSVDVPINIAETAPAIFSAGNGPAVVHQNGALVTNAAPAVNGEIVTIYLTGLGAVDGDVVAGQPSPSSPPLSVRGPVQVHLGTATMQPLFAGLTPGFSGLYQVNVRVPDDLTGGIHPLDVMARGVRSRPVTLSVRASSRTPELGPDRVPARELVFAGPRRA